jgi:ketosteroid isomerase-like protein
MEHKLSTIQIRKYAKVLDDAIKRRNVEEIVSCFSNDCEVELLGIKLNGKDGLNKAIGWMFRYLNEIVLIPVTIMVTGDVFFEEFMVKAKVKGGKEIQVKQAEVLDYNDVYKVKSLRRNFYFQYRRENND